MSGDEFEAMGGVEMGPDGYLRALGSLEEFLGQSRAEAAILEGQFWAALEGAYQADEWYERNELALGSALLRAQGDPRDVKPEQE